VASRGDHHRQAWFDCACCPPNIARLIASVGGYLYSQGDGQAWVHLYAQGQGRLEVDGRDVVLEQITAYPWDGTVKIRLGLSSPLRFALHVRVPAWCGQWEVRVNGGAVASSVARPPTAGVGHEKGYLHLSREWQPRDEVELNMAMPVRNVSAHPSLRHALGRIALQRGPIVYCLEGVDHDDIALDRIAVPKDDPSRWQTEHHDKLLGGVTVLRGMGSAMDEEGWGDELYRFEAPGNEPINVIAVPYCVWDNRSPGEMRVWLRTSIV